MLEWPTAGERRGGRALMLRARKHLHLPHLPGGSSSVSLRQDSKSHPSRVIESQTRELLVFHGYAVVGGLAGGALGAALWAVVAVLTNYEIGWIAWAIGGMVGFGVATGNRGGAYSPRTAGLLAVAITVLAIPVGKYAAIKMSFPTDDELVEALLQNVFHDEYVISHVADAVVEEFTADGRELDWPLGVDPATAASQGEYPADVWTEAEERWTDMSEEERASFRSDVEEATRANITRHLPEIRASIGEDAFIGSFGGMDLLFFGLAMVTAFRVAAGGEKKTVEKITEEFRESVKLAMVEMMLVDGAVDETERRVVRELHATITGLELSEDELNEEIALAKSGQKDVLLTLGELAPYLNDQGKGMVITAALRVAAADGEFREEEKDLIRDIAAALGVGEDQLQGLLTRLRAEAGT